MEISVIGICNQAFPRKKLNILTAPTHEAYETNLCKTGHNFYAVEHESFKKWNTKYRPVPSNYTICENGKIPYDVNFDLVLSQNKFGQFQVLSEIASKLHIPLISLEHTLPVPNWDQRTRDFCKNMRGDLNVFISNYSIEKWGFDRFDPYVRVVHHGIDIDLFKPNGRKNNHILCVCNDWINRDWCCGFQIFNRTASDLPICILGDTPGLSAPANSTEELVSAYQYARLFYNTSTISPVPTALMEAMSCGCAIVSTATCMIPEIITNGVNGLISNDESELRRYLIQLLNDEMLSLELGNQARKTIVENFPISKFVESWNEVFYEATGVNPCR